MPILVKYESTVLEYLDKFVVEPINYILSPPCLIENLLELTLCRHKARFWKLEVTFPGSRAIAERCRRESE